MHTHVHISAHVCMYVDFVSQQVVKCTQRKAVLLHLLLEKA